MTVKSWRSRIGKTSRHVLLLLIAMALVALAGCDSRSSQASDSPATDMVIRIGTMATEDMLPYWVADDQNLFEAAGLEVEIIVFQSAQELSTAMAAAEIDMAMTDLMVSISLAAGEVSLEILWVTLGQTADQGRFGILAHPDREIRTLQDLAGVPVAIGSNTIPEYTFDRLMAAAGIPADQIAYEEIKIVPVRYEMLVNNQVAAAALPASLLFYGQQNGMILVADDLVGENISQTVMIARCDFVDKLGESYTYQALQDVWNQAVELINTTPEAWRAVLVEKAQLPAEIADIYPVPEYPSAARAADWMVGNVVDWMNAKGYLTAPVSYNPLTGHLVRD